MGNKCAICNKSMETDDLVGPECGKKMAKGAGLHKNVLKNKKELMRIASHKDCPDHFIKEIAELKDLDLNRALEKNLASKNNTIPVNQNNTLTIKQLEGNTNDIYSTFWQNNEDSIDWKQEEVVLDFGDKKVKTVQDVGYLDNQKIAIRYNANDLNDQDSFNRVVFTNDIKAITKKELENLKAKKDHEMVYKHFNDYNPEDSDEKFYDYIGDLDDNEVEKILDEDFSPSLREKYDQVSEELEDNIRNYIEKTKENVEDGTIDRNDVCSKEEYEKAYKDGTELDLAKSFFLKKDSMYIDTVDSSFDDHSPYKKALARIAYKKIESEKSYLLDEYADMIFEIHK